MGVLVRVLQYLRSRPARVTVMLALVLVGLLGLLDRLTGPELSFSIFYLIPISLTAWVLGRRWAMLISGMAMLCWLWAEAASGHAYTQTHILYWNAFIRLGYFVIVGYLFDNTRASLERARTLSRTDPLTGAMNKLAFQEFAEEELERIWRYPHPLSVAYVDLDNFKHVNDTLGHGVGDKLLEAVVETLQRVMRKTDAVARLGGDEFAIVMVETRAHEARRAILKAQAALLSTMQAGGWPVTFSIGVVTYMSPPESVDKLLAVADDLMYDSKHSGKNRISYKIVTSERVIAPKHAEAVPA